MNSKFLQFVLLCVFLFCANIRADAQSRIDSMLQQLSKAKNDTSRIHEMIQLAYEYSNSDIDKSVEFGKKILLESERIGFIKGMKNAYNVLGIDFATQSKYKEAKEMYRKALEITTKQNDESGMATLLNNMGIVASREGFYDEAIGYYLASLKINEKLGDKMKEMTCLINLSSSIQERDTVKGMTYAKRALGIAKQLKSNAGIASCYNIIGSVYLTRKKFPDAENYFLKSLAVYIREGDSIGVSTNYSCLANCYSSWGNKIKAIDYFTRGLRIDEYMQDDANIALSLASIGKEYLFLGNNKLAIEYADRSIKVSAKIDARYTPELKNAYEVMAEANANLGNEKDALIYYRKFMTVQDTLYEEANVRTISEMETKYETEKKERENDKLLQQNQIQQYEISRKSFTIYGLVVVVVLIFVIGFISLRQNRLRAKQKNVEIEQRLLRSQMNPHFIFNSMNAIQSYIFKNDPRNAGIYLSRFAELMRMILENSRHEYVSLEKEIKSLTYYLELQALRFEGKFDYSIYVDEKISADSISIPPMLAQPLIENALEHGILHKKDKGLLWIRFILKGNMLLFEVEDNGIGREKSAEIKRAKQVKHASLATSITKERLEILNKGNQKILFNIIDLKDETGEACGTKVVFEIEYI